MWQFEQSARKGGNVWIFDPSGLWLDKLDCKYNEIRERERERERSVPVDTAGRGDSFLEIKQQLQINLGNRVIVTPFLTIEDAGGVLSYFF